LTLDLPS